MTGTKKCSATEAGNADDLILSEDDDGAMNAQSTALLAAINASIGVKVEQVATSMGAIERKVISIEATQMKHEAEISLMRGEIGKIKSEIQSPSRAASSAGGSEMDFRTPIKNPAEDYVKPSDRRLMIIGGFERDTPKSVIEAVIRDILKDYSEKVEDFYAPGKYTSFAKIKWKKPSLMWEFITAHKGQRIGPEKNLWFTVEKSQEERSKQQRVSKAFRNIQAICVAHKPDVTEESVKDYFECDWTKGIIFLKQSNGTGGHTVQRVLERGYNTGEFTTTANWHLLGLPAGALEVSEFLAEINSA